MAKLGATMDENFLYFGLGIMLAIPTGIIANILTHRILAWNSRRSVGTRNRNIKQLESILKQVADLKHDNTKLTATLGRDIAIIITACLFELMAMGFLLMGWFVADLVVEVYGLHSAWILPMLALPFLSVINLFAILAAWVAFEDAISLANRILSYEEFERITRKRLSELGAHIDNSVSGS